MTRGISLSRSAQLGWSAFIEGDVMNKLKARLKSGKACVNAWLAIPSGFSAEVMAQCGFDSVTVDMQHGVQDYQSMVQCFQAMDKYPITPMVRVPWNEPGIIGKVLDGGAWGVICPMVNTPAEAKALATASLSAQRQAQQWPDPRGGLRRGKPLSVHRQ
jgi:4-hydroxy-2-oxoheptanedioate aldolase